MENKESQENPEKITPESLIKNVLLFSSLKEGFFDFQNTLKNNLSKFNSDKKTELSQFSFEYICYKNTKNLISKGKKINQDILIINDQFLLNENCKEFLFKNNFIHKKNIIICIQNKQTLKWNLIAFLNLEEQIKNYFDTSNKRPITAKILSSNSNSEEDDFILNDAMDKLENSFNFKSPDDIQFEVDSFNISGQPNTSIFLINFINGLIIKDNAGIFEFIKKLYDEGSNELNSESKLYFNTFNNISKEMNEIYDTYQKELKEYSLKNNIELNINELDEELNSDEEEEALRIMEKESEEANNLMRQKQRKMRQKLYKQKLNEKNMIMYKEFGIIKEEDNESESESIDIFGKMKEKEEERKKHKENSKNKNGVIKNNQQILNNLNVNININVNNSQNIEDIKTNIYKSEEDLKIKNKSKSEKSVKLNSLKELEEAIEEFELEQEPMKNTEENMNQKKEEKKGGKKIIEQNKTEKKTIPVNIKAKKEEKEKEEKEEIKKEVIIKTKKEKNKMSNKTSNNMVKMENIELKKRASVPKSQIKTKKLQLDNKNQNSKITEKFKKSFTSTKRPENKDLFKEDKENEKEDDLFIKSSNNNLLAKKKSTPLREMNKDNKIVIKKAVSDNVISQYKEKNSKQISINININNNSFKTFDSSNTKTYKEEEKNSKILNKENKIKENPNHTPINKEPRDNYSKKIADLNLKNLPKRNNNNKLLNKKSLTTSKLSKSTQDSQIPYNSKKSSSSSNKSEEGNNSVKNLRNKIKPFFRENNLIEEKATLNMSTTDNPINILPPPKLVERNFLDLSNKEKEKEKEEHERDFSNNINIDNITNDISEKDKKSDISDKSHAGRIKENKMRKNEKKNPPRKIRNSHRYQYGKLEQEGADKICGCIGEQANGYCNIF